MSLSYEIALEMYGIETLASRRKKKCLNCALKCMKHPTNSRLFPWNTRTHGQGQASKETVEVNWSKTKTYRLSTIPYCQRLLTD